MANVLNFSTDNLITGVNLIDGNLYWTDDRNEPKKIVIERFKESDIGDNGGATTIDNRVFEHTDITVIRPHPYKPIELSLTEYTPTDNLPEPPFERIFPRFSYRWKYEDGQYSPYAPFTQAAFMPAPRRLTSTGTRGDTNFVPDTEEENYVEGFNTTMYNNVGSITLNNIPRGTADVVEIDLLYTESISSTIYVLETLVIPEDQRGIDFTVNTAYTNRVQADGFGATSGEDYSLLPLSYTLSARKIYSALPANQLRRPFDNVPRLAKSQEVTANRLIYGNYLQNYNQLDGVNLSVSTIPAESFPQYEDTTHADYNSDIQSHLLAQSQTDGLHVKGNRTYEIGVAYIDAFGRQGAMLQNTSTINDDGTFNEASAFRTNFNQGSREALSVQITTDPPSWADSYRYFIKDASMDYHNLVSYNIYNDGGVEDVNSEFIWIEFQSTDRNKVFEQSQALDGETGTVLSLRRINDEIQDRKTRFLVQDIQNEAPEDVRRQVSQTVTNTRSSAVGQLRSNVYDTIGTRPTVNDPTWDLGSPSGNLDIFNTVLNFFNRFVQSNQGEVAQPANLSTSHDSGSIGAATNIDVDLTQLEADLFVRLQDRGGSNAYYGGRNRYVQVERVQSFDQGRTPNTDGLRITLGPHIEVDEETGEITPLDSTGWPGMDLITNRDANMDFITTRTSDEAIERLGGRFWVRTARNGLDTIQSEFTFDGELDNLQQLWFETEPAVAESNLDLFWETSDTFCVCTDHGYPNKLNWFNSVAEISSTATNPGVYLEATRINDRFNTVQLVRGVRVNVPTERFSEERRAFGLTWSGIYNSRTGINRFNEFISSDGITKDLEPNYGGIQKLHTRDTNIIAFCEDKVFSILADKDLLFNADGGGNVSAANVVLGQTTPFVGEYGISTSPESFASYGHNVWFSDSKRGVVCQLTPGNGQINEISSAGMNDFFRDRLFSANNIVGMFDDYSDKYIISIQGYNQNDPNIDANGSLGDDGNLTLGYELDVQGWSSRMSFIPEDGLTLNNKFYTWDGGKIWRHNSPTSTNYNMFYGTAYNSEIEIIFNDAPSNVLDFLTLNYEGTDGWELVSITTDQDSATLLGDFISREGKHYQSIVANVPNYVYDSTQPNNVRQDGTRMRSGAKGFYCKVRMRTKTGADSQSFQELFAISSEVIPSS